MLWLTGKALAQLRVLSGDANRAGVEVTLTHHQAAFSDQRCGGKAYFVSTEHSRDHYVAACSYAAVRLYSNTAAQTVHNEGLVGFSKADFPG